MTVVGYSSRYVPAGLIEAAGHEARFVMPRLMHRAASLLMRREGLCPFAAGTVNTLMEDSMDAFVGAGICDQSRRCFEQLRQSWCKPMFLLNVPATVGGAADRMFDAEMKRMGRFLAGLPGGCKVSETYGPVGNHELAENAECRSLAIIGAPVAAEGDELKRMAGGDATEFTGPIWHGGDVVDIRQRPNNGWFEWLRYFTSTSGVRGILLHRYTWCDPWHAETQRIKRVSAVPVLDLEISDAGSYSSVNTVTRVQAFLEMIG